MDFYEILEQIRGLLRRRGRVTYSALKVQFRLDDDHLAALQEELIEAERVAVDEHGKVLVWIGTASSPQEPAPPAPQPVPRLVVQAAHSAHIVSPLATPRPPAAERRQLTVLFCDLVGSTPLSERLDPEDWREVVQAYQAACAEVVQRFDGHIAQLLGDALLVYFGWPQAHEDDALRAVHTGIGMLGAMGLLNTRLAQDRGLRLAIRVGIHTGLVVVGAMGGAGRQEQLALGEVPNVASRLQGLAAPDTVLLGEATYRLVQGYVTVEALGPQALKGMTQPIGVYRVLGESGVQSRLDVATIRGLTPAARELLAEVYGWFTEGFDTADLRDAQALLEALGKGQS